jgi:hypothetical protein
MTQAANLAAVGSYAVSTGLPFSGASTITSGTAQASTSGTSIDFTSIPSWVKRITVMFNGISTNGTSPIQIQIGSGSVTTSGYKTQGSYISGSAALAIVFSTGFVFINSAGSAFAYSGAVTLTLIGSNTWCGTGTVSLDTATSAIFMSSGSSPALSGTLDRVRITTVNGTDTFDAGTINILYE